MSRKTCKSTPLSARNLDELCELVINCAAPYEDVAEYIEDRAFAESCAGNLSGAVERLVRIADFFEQFELKNEEICGDLAEVCVLIGEMYQHSGEFERSLPWFEKAIIVNDRYDAPYHGIAASYLRLGNTEGAIRSLQQEILVAPGNYYSYLLLAELYEQRNEIDQFTHILEILLERDADNVRALHKLIVHYQRENPALNVNFLRERILRSRRKNAKLDLLIWVYHMCIAGKHREALSELIEREERSPNLSIIHLLKAFIFGDLGQFAKKRAELALFKEQNFGKGDIVRNKLTEFASVFGEDAAQNLDRSLSTVRPAG